MPITKEQVQIGLEVTTLEDNSAPEEEVGKHYKVAIIHTSSNGEITGVDLENGWAYDLESLDLYQEPSLDQEIDQFVKDHLPKEEYLEEPVYNTFPNREYNTTLSIPEDPINPSHYQGKEVFNQMVTLFGVEEVKVFCRLNAYKYLSRAGKKEGNPIDQEVKKALWYLKEYDNLNSIPNE